MLIRSGRINLPQYDESVKLLKKTGKRQGAILVELGYITPRELFQGVKHQVKEIIYSLFNLEDGPYEFNEKMPPPEEVITLKMGTGSLIYEGVKRINSVTRIRKELPHGEAIFLPAEAAPALLKEIELAKDEKMILSLIDGNKTLNEILAASECNSFSAMKTLYFFRLIGIVAEKREEKESLSIEDILGSA